MARGRKRMVLGWGLIAFAAAAVSSRWWWVRIHFGGGWAVGTTSGVAWAAYVDHVEPTDAPRLLTRRRTPSEWYWRGPHTTGGFKYGGAAGRLTEVGFGQFLVYPTPSRHYWEAYLLLWPFAAASLIGAPLLLISGRRVKRRATAGLCPACGYSLAGLGPGMSCPECGKRDGPRS